jgi:hypothetical protein
MSLLIVAMETLVRKKSDENLGDILGAYPKTSERG